MSGNVDLTLILRNTADASRDARAALDATERFIEAFGPRLSALEARFGALESRTAGIERSLDGIARATVRMERMVGDILAALQRE